MKPILFNTENVQAILENRKTVTRRVVKPQPVCSGPNTTFAPHDDSFFLSKENNRLRCRVCGHAPQYSYEGSNVAHHWTPPYRPGDILYVRETWRPISAWSGSYTGCRIEYKAGGVQIFDEVIALPTQNGEWHPSIHMPREAARIFLRVMDVMVERLHDINERGPLSAASEGFTNDIDLRGGTGKSATKHFAECWDSTIKPKERAIYGWEANPWVWVIEFERISKEETT